MLYQIRASNFTKRIYLGGNHLAALPIHLYAHEKGLTSIIFDAHRDYKNEQAADPTVTPYEWHVNTFARRYDHSNFLNAFNDLSNFYIYGYRDINACTSNGCHLYSPMQKNEFLRDISFLIKDSKKFYIDIDVDVFSPSYFSATACPVDNGVMLDDLYELIRFIGFDNIEMFSIEEYTPLMDDGRY